MNKINKKRIRLIWMVSVLSGICFLGYGGYSQNNPASLVGLKKTDRNPPDSVKYFIGRNEVFKNLPNDTDEVIMLGNSLTHNFEWHEIFKNVNIKNRGINSDITRGILQRLNEVVESKPKKIFIEIGVNDLLHGLTIDSVYDNYKLIIQTIKLKSPKTRIYIQSVLPNNWKIYNTDKPVINSVIILNDKLKDYCQNNGLIYIDLYSKFLFEQRLNPIYDCGDKLHLSGKGYLLWCSLIKEYIYD